MKRKKKEVDPYDDDDDKPCLGLFSHLLWLTLFSPPCSLLETKHPLDSTIIAVIITPYVIAH